MPNQLTAHASVTINAPASKVWSALTNPSQIKKYLFGTEAVSDWKVGSPLLFRGVWEGKAYLDKGTILRAEPEKVFEYTYLSSFSGLPDVPQNYHTITCELTSKPGATDLRISQSNIQTEQAKKHAEENWGGVLKTMKEVVESA
jgi:uncharacterized protein YndB with AHSA1/START domain